MLNLGEAILAVFKEAWGFFVAVIIVVAMLVMLAQVLKVASASSMGANLWVWQAIGSMFGIVMLVLFGFVGVPEIIRASMDAIPNSAGCGPIMELATFSAILIGAIGSLRAIKAVLVGVISAAVQSSGVVTSALIDVSEAIVGMLVASMATPIAFYFLGAGC